MSEVDPITIKQIKLFANRTKLDDGKVHILCTTLPPLMGDMEYMKTKVLIYAESGRKVAQEYCNKLRDYAIHYSFMDYIEIEEWQYNEVDGLKDAILA